MQNLINFLMEHRQIFTLVCIVGLIFCAKKIFKPDPDKENNRAQRVYKKVNGKTHTFYRWRALCSKAVEFASKVPVLGEVLQNTSFTYVCEYAIPQEAANYMAGRNLLTFCGSFVVAFICCMFWFKDIILSLIASIMLAISVLSYFRIKPVRFLTNVQDAVDDFIHAYHTNHGNLDEAFAAVIQAGGPVSGHFRTMYDYIRKADVSAEPEAIQKEYYAIAPARVLRQLYSVIYMTYKYGDEEVDGKSQFTKSIFELQKSIADQLYTQNKLADGVYGLRWFIVCPIFALPYVADYMMEYFTFEGFEFIEMFLNSPWGYATEVLCAGISLLCFLLFDNMVKSTVIEPKKIVSWEEKALRNIRIRKIVQKTSPKEKQRIALQTHIMKSGSTESIEALTIRRVATTIMVCVVCIFSVSLNVWKNVDSITNNIYQGLAHDQYTQILLTQNDVEEYIDEQTLQDKQVLAYLKTVDGYEDMTSEEQEDVIRQYMRQEGLTYRGYQSYAIQRIMSKHDMVEQSKGFTNFLFVLLFTIAAWYTPIWAIYFQSFLNKDILISDETTDLQSMTVMLINHSTCTPEQLLSWYADSSILFEKVFREAQLTGNFSCLHGFVDYKPFNQLVNCLELSFGGMGMDEAFADIEQKRAIQEKERGRTDEKNVTFRLNVIEFFSNLSMYSVLCLYMFIPMLIAMVFMFKDMAAAL